MDNPEISIFSFVLITRSPPHSLSAPYPPPLRSETDRAGYIQAAIAEQKDPALTQRLASRLRDSLPLPPHLLGYNDMCGLPALRMAVATHLQRTLSGGLPPGSAPISVDHDHIVCASGAAAVLEGLFFCLGEPGDGVLVPAPFYPAFVGDLEGKPGLKVIPVHSGGGSAVPTTEALSDAVATAAANGTRVVALLLTNPVNPSGVVLSPGTVQGLIRWAIARRIHVVSDEIYYGSVWSDSSDGGGARFETAMRGAALASQQLGLGEGARRALVHVVWGLSKDFAASGLRVGVLWTHNEGVLRAFSQALSPFCAVSNETQCHVKDLLTARCSRLLRSDVPTPPPPCYCVLPVKVHEA